MAHTREARTLTLAAAKAMAEAGEAEAARRGWTVAIAVVNPEGGLIRSAARFRRPTKALEDAVAGGRTALLGVPGLLALEGGAPLILDGAVVGAVGVSGMASSEDGAIAAAALRAFEG